MSYTSLCTLLSLFLLKFVTEVEVVHVVVIQSSAVQGCAGVRAWPQYCHTLPRRALAEVPVYVGCSFTRRGRPMSSWPGVCSGRVGALAQCIADDAGGGDRQHWERQEQFVFFISHSPYFAPGDLSFFFCNKICCLPVCT